MADWLKIGLTIIGVAVTVWTMVQQHDYRISRLEDGFDKHLATHEMQYKEIGTTLLQIQIGLGRLSGAQDRDTRAIASGSNHASQ